MAGNNRDLDIKIISNGSVLDSWKEVATETEECFIFDTIRPYCEQVTRREIKKEDLKKALSLYLNGCPVCGFSMARAFNRHVDMNIPKNCSNCKNQNPVGCPYSEECYSDTLATTPTYWAAKEGSK